jgi:hypothetical protein
MRRNSQSANNRTKITAVLALAVAATAVAQQSGAAQPELKSAKIEFIPGEKAVVFDDFSDMAAEEPPPHWKVREGKVDLKIGGNVRELFSADPVKLISPKIAIPQNFTFELVWTGAGEMTWIFRDKDDQDAIHAVVRGEADGQTASVSVSSKDELGTGMIIPTRRSRSPSRCGRSRVGSAPI